MNKIEDFAIPPLAVVCHDAGAANLIVSWLKDYRSEARVCMEGPAKVIWERNFPDNKLFPISRVMDGSNTLLSGTGWGDLEYFARVQAKKRNIKNIAVIDHWSGYKERFVRDEKELLPDLIFVSDKYANKKACDTFPLILVVQLPNNYLQLEANLVSSVRVRECQTPIENILIIGEPFREKILGRDSTLEFIAIEYLMLNLDKINLSRNLVNITLRPHPSEPIDKYNFIQDKYQDFVTEFKIGRNRELYEDIAWADLVVGVSSFAMVVSLFAGVPTMSIVPPGSTHNVLPYEEIMHLRDQ
ncbi:hypothetical protein OAJ68_02300 [Candidatus Thioglobus sp.]|nr:hypothetical protein [Candidatus Thioglobus sp.]